MLDSDKILKKIDELNTYLKELESIQPADFREYVHSVEKKRSCERLLQISVESVIDICNLLVSGLGLGVPADEDALFDKLEQRKILSENVAETSRAMKGFRNVLVHKYEEVNDELVFENLSRLNDFETFKKEVVSFLSSYKKHQKNDAPSAA